MTMISAPVNAALARLQAGAEASVPANAKHKVSPDGAKRVARDFEALFISEMMAPVFNSVNTDGLFGGGEGEKIYRSMMVQEYGKAIAKAGGVGIAEAVQREILKMQETHQ